MAFHVGQKVVCVDDDYDSRWLPCARLQKGSVYTIRGIGVSSSGEVGIRVVEAELSAPSNFRGCNTGEVVRDNFYRASRFRPLTDRKSEVSFTMGADPESERWDNRKRVKVRS